MTVENDTTFSYRGRKKFYFLSLLILLMCVSIDVGLETSRQYELLLTIGDVILSLADDSIILLK